MCPYNMPPMYCSQRVIVEQTNSKCLVHSYSILVRLEYFRAEHPNHIVYSIRHTQKPIRTIDTNRALRIMYCSVNDTGILGIRKSECS